MKRGLFLCCVVLAGCGHTEEVSSGGHVDTSQDAGADARDAARDASLPSDASAPSDASPPRSVDASDAAARDASDDRVEDADARPTCVPPAVAAESVIQPSWRTTLDGVYGSLSHVAVDGQGNVFAAGLGFGSLASSTSPTDGGAGPSSRSDVTDALLVKLDPHGNVSWSRFFGEGNPEGLSASQITGMIVDSTGDLTLTGSFGARIGFGSRTAADGGSTALALIDQSPSLFVAKLHGDGTPVFSRAYTPSAYPGGNVGGKIASDGAGGSVVVNDFYPGGRAAFIVTRLDAAGRTTLESSYANATISDVFLTPSGTILIVGTGTGSSVNFSAPLENPSALDPNAVLTATTGTFPFLLELTKAGAYVRSRTLNSPSGLVSLTYASEDAAGNLYVSGTIPSNGSSAGEQAVAKFDSAGNALWDFELAGTSGSRTIGGIAASASGELVVTGGYQGSLAIPTATAGTFASFGPTSSSDLFVAEFHTDGQLAGAGKLGGMWAQFGAGAAFDPSTNDALIVGFDGTRDDEDAPGYELIGEVASPPVVLRLPAKNAFVSQAPPVDTTPPAHILGQYDELSSADPYPSGTLIYQRVAVDHPALLSGFGWITNDDVPADKDTSVVFGLYTDDWSGAVPYSPLPESLVYSTGPVSSLHAAGRFETSIQSCVYLAPGYYWVALGWLHDRSINGAAASPYSPELPLFAGGAWPTTTRPAPLPNPALEPNTGRFAALTFYALTEAPR